LKSNDKIFIKEKKRKKTEKYYFILQTEKMTDKLIFPENFTDEKLFAMLKKVVKGLAKEDRETNHYVEQSHKFLLSSTFRNGEINADSIKKYLDIDDDSNIFISPRAVRSGIEFLFIDQEDGNDDYNIDETGFQKVDAAMCTKCYRSIKESALYTCCDQIYPIQKSWFNSFKCYCKDCHQFFLDGEEEMIDANYQELFTAAFVSIQNKKSYF
jgi:hypothetical protein